MLEITVKPIDQIEWDKPLPDYLKGGICLTVRLVEKAMEIHVLIEAGREEDYSTLAYHFECIAFALKRQGMVEKGELPISPE